MIWRLKLWDNPDDFKPWDTKFGLLKIVTSADSIQILSFAICKLRNRIKFKFETALSFWRTARSNRNLVVDTLRRFQMCLSQTLCGFNSASGLYDLCLQQQTVCLECPTNFVSLKQINHSSAKKCIYYNRIEWLGFIWSFLRQKLLLEEFGQKEAAPCNGGRNH